MKVYILIPTRNRKEYLLQCLKSLKEQTYKDIEIVIIDDGSTDGTKDIISKENVTLLKGDGNLWWTGAMRLGVEYILPKANKGDYILIQNDDTYMYPKYIEELVKLSGKNKRICLGTTLVEKESGKKIYNSHRIVKGSFRPALIESDEEIIDTETISGRGALIPLEVFQSIGNFSKLFPQYASDYDFFCRAKKKGFRLGVSNNIETISTNPKPNLSKRIKSNKKISFKDFLQLYFSRRSSNNLWSSTLITILYIPWRCKIYGVGRIYLSVVKVFIIDCLFNYLIK